MMCGHTVLRLSPEGKLSCDECGRYKGRMIRCATCNRVVVGRGHRTQRCKACAMDRNAELSADIQRRLYAE